MKTKRMTVLTRPHVSAFTIWMNVANLLLLALVAALNWKRDRRFPIRMIHIVVLIGMIYHLNLLSSALWPVTTDPWCTLHAVVFQFTSVSLVVWNTLIVRSLQCMLLNSTPVAELRRQSTRYYTIGTAIPTVITGVVALLGAAGPDASLPFCWINQDQAHVKLFALEVPAMLFVVFVLIIAIRAAILFQRRYRRLPQLHDPLYPSIRPKIRNFLIRQVVLVLTFAILSTNAILYYFIIDYNMYSTMSYTVRVMNLFSSNMFGMCIFAAYGLSHENIQQFKQLCPRDNNDQQYTKL